MEIDFLTLMIYNALCSGTGADPELFKENVDLIIKAQLIETIISFVIFFLIVGILFYVNIRFDKRG